MDVEHIPNKVHHTHNSAKRSTGLPNSTEIVKARMSFWLVVNSFSYTPLVTGDVFIGTLY